MARLVFMVVFPDSTTTCYCKSSSRWDDPKVLLTLVLFLAASAAIAAAWNRFFPRVPWRIVVLFVALVAVHQGETLFTEKVAIPGISRFSPYPWKIIDAPPVRANNGIVFTQLAPWTRIAR